MSVILPGAPRPNPHKPVQPLAADIEAGLINTCCLREDNLYVSEYETDHRMVRKCRRCHRKHYTMKADAIDLAAIFGSPNVIRTQGGRRHIRMGADPGRMSG
jgi:hypothetical protein